MLDRPLIALVGRPNVGKSTVFNRLIGRRAAITSHIAGTTRDRHFGITEWFGHSWTLVDTAGLLFDDEVDSELEKLQSATEAQVEVAMFEANVIVLVVDAKEGIQPADKAIMNLLRNAGKPVVVMVNKADSPSLRVQAEEFHQLGVENLFIISAIHASGLRDFIDWLIEHFPSPNDQVPTPISHIAIIGRPNVGKSSLINQLTGVNRMVVSDVPGTTRDSIQTEFNLTKDKKALIVDTAGLRRRGQIEAGIEKFSLFRTIKAVNQADIVLLMISIEEAPARSDAHIAQFGIDAGKKVLVVLNKCDLAQQSIFRLNLKEQIRLAQKYLQRFPFLQRLPFVFISASTGQGIKELKAAISDLLSIQKT